jgi:hypothetical protein
LSIMQCGSKIINFYLKQDWNTYELPPKENVNYYHSGGNMIVMIAGMLCYLYDKNRDREKGNGYGTDILENIRQRFELLIQKNMVTFYTWLNLYMLDPVFRDSLNDCTENISDLDFILMAPKKYVSNIDTPELIKINELSANIIRKIMITAYSVPPALPADMIINAQALLPFHGKFGPPWKKFGFYKMPPGPMKFLLPAVDGDTYRGYRQTSNRIDEVPMYLNRLKQGYLPFFNIQGFPNIAYNLPPPKPDINPNDIALTYSNKYGECIDLSIGTLENELYHHKHQNYENHVYYTIDTILWELEQILLKPPDDKTPKRTIRRNFLTLIDTPEINILFQAIVFYIQVL